MKTVKERLEKLEKDNQIQFRFIQNIIAIGTGDKQKMQEAAKQLKKEIDSS